MFRLPAVPVLRENRDLKVSRDPRVFKENRGLKVRRVPRVFKESRALKVGRDPKESRDFKVGRDLKVNWDFKVGRDFPEMMALPGTTVVGHLQMPLVLQVISTSMTITAGYTRRLVHPPGDIRLPLPKMSHHTAPSKSPC